MHVNAQKMFKSKSLLQEAISHSAKYLSNKIIRSLMNNDDENCLIQTKALQRIWCKRLQYAMCYFCRL
jgi:ATP/maltotriose-dependent transcriptional regulator MalT